MPKHRKRKRRQTLDGRAVDLFCPVPKGGSKGVHRLLQRLQEAGYQSVALTHTIYGKPSSDDAAYQALPSSLWRDSETTVKVLRRLHVVIENLSDVGLYSAQESAAYVQTITKDYDLLSISPRNEAVFQSVCQSNCDIISLESCASSGISIRTTDLRHIESQKGVLELPYASAVLNKNARKSLVQVSCQILQASAKPHLIVSSGSRIAEGIDQMTMAIRTAGDVANVIHTVMGFDRRKSSLALCSTAALEHAHSRRFGRTGSTVIHRVTHEDSVATKHANKKSKQSSPYRESRRAGAETDPVWASHSTETKEDKADDGFIALS